MNEFDSALYEAFLSAGVKLGERAKGMSCFLRNWKSILPAAAVLVASSCTNPNNPSPQAGGGSSAAAMIYGSMLYNEAIRPQPQPSYGYITCSHGQYSSLCSVR